MKMKTAKRVVTADVAVTECPSSEIMVMPRRVTVPVVANLKPKHLAEPGLGSFGVLVVLMDRVCSPRTMDCLAQLALGWQNHEIVFLSAACARVGQQAINLFPRLFYNADEQVSLDHLWKLLPWRTVVVLKTGKVCCLAPRNDSNVQPLSTQK